MGRAGHRDGDGDGGEPPPVGGLGLSLRVAGLLALRVAHPLIGTAGALAMLPLGGIVPVARGWLRDEVAGWGDLVAALGGVRPAVESTDPDADFGPALTRSDAPGLFADVAELSRRVGLARPPGQLRLAYLPCCCAVAWGRGRRGGRALLVGLPLLYVLDRDELRAVLAHELAHLARGDATATAKASRYVEALGRAIVAAGPAASGPLAAWSRACYAAGSRLRAPLARGQEARADRAAAAAAGGDALAAALVKVAIVQPLFREVLDRYDPARPGVANLYAFFRTFWSRLPESVVTDLRHRLLAERRGGAGGAHPPLLDRLAAAQTYARRRDADGAGPAPAIGVLGDPEGLEAMLHGRLYGGPSPEPSVFHRAGS